MKQKIKIQLSLGLLSFIFIYCLSSCQEKKAEPPKNNPYEKAEIEIKVFNNNATADSALQGFGYDIYLNKGLYVHQPHIPAVNGNRGFKTAEDAQKTGELTAFKIKNNIMPPSLSVNELDSIGVLK